VIIEDKIIRARTLVEALPYIKEFKGKTIIIKYGGSIMVNPELQRVFAEDVVLLKYVGINPVIVHGGGKDISRWMEKVGKEAVFIDGLRYTDHETMEITEMVLSGKVNNQLVSLINQHGGKAVGLSGKDADLLIAKQIKSNDLKDLGFVGEIQKIDFSLITTLSDQGYIPVISSVARSEDGQTLNMNADNVAAGIAKAMSAEKLIYLTDVKGIKVDNEIVGRVSFDDAQKLMSHPDIKGGMIPKLKCSLDAIGSGVHRVHIINGSTEHAVLLELFTDDGIGTMIQLS
jgi:acetylglutamate kinase